MVQLLIVVFEVSLEAMQDQSFSLPDIIQPVDFFDDCLTTAQQLTDDYNSTVKLKYLTRQDIDEKIDEHSQQNFLTERISITLYFSQKNKDNKQMTFL